MILKPKEPSDLQIAVTAANSLAHYYKSFQCCDSDEQRSQIPVPQFSDTETNWLQMSADAAVDLLTNLDDEINKAKAFIN